jgi:hypothetical protein
LLRYDRKYTSKNNGEQRLGNSAFCSVICCNITKSVFENRFGDFALIFSNKYNKVYRDRPPPSSFTIALFFVQVISFAFFIQISLSYFGYASKTDWILYIQIVTFFTFFILAKYLIEKIIATSFEIEEFWNNSVFKSNIPNLYWVIHAAI